MKKILLLMLMIVFMFSLSEANATSVTDEVMERGVLRIGSGNTLPPLNYVDANGKWTGFDIDLGDALAEKLGLKVERVVVNNKTRIAYLANNRIDVAISCMSHTKSRDEQVDYAEPPYLWTGKIFYCGPRRREDMREPGLQCLHRGTAGDSKVQQSETQDGKRTETERLLARAPEGQG